MTRQNNIVLTYLIIKTFNSEVGEPIDPLKLKTYIKSKCAVTEMTARDYITQLLNGTTIKGKVYKIVLDGIGFRVKEETKC